jgi:DNA-binding LacI/PurR family transcriptional regulator
MEHVLSLGHKRIGIITVAAPLNFSVPPRMLGFHTAAEAHGIDFATLPKCEGDFSITSGAKCVAQLLQQHLDLTAIICINDRMALGAIQQVQRNGLLVPDDLTIVGYDDIPLARFVVPALTTIDQHAPELGRIATQMLFDILNDKTPDPVTIPTQLVIRQSSAPPKK